MKTPHGSQMMLLLAIVTAIAFRRRKASGDVPTGPDLIVLLTPGLVVLVLVSSQLEFNHHVRYVLPALGFAYTFVGVTARWLSSATRQP